MPLHPSQVKEQTTTSLIYTPWWHVIPVTMVHKNLTKSHSNQNILLHMGKSGFGWDNNFHSVFHTMSIQWRVHFLSASQISLQEYSLVMSYYLCIPKVSKVRLSVFVIHRELSNLSERWLSCNERFLCGYSVTVFEKYWSVCKICRVVTICCQQIISLEQKKNFSKWNQLVQIYRSCTGNKLLSWIYLHSAPNSGDMQLSIPIIFHNLYPVEISGSSDLIHCVVYPHSSPFLKQLTFFGIHKFAHTCTHVYFMFPN